MKTLKLTLKKQWFDLIKSGEKREEYREIKPYWFQRLVFNHEKVFEYCTGYCYEGLYITEGVAHICKNKKSMVGFEPFDQVQFTNGYSANSPRMTVKCKGIRIGTGKPEWGAEPGVNYFVIELGNALPCPKS